MPPAPELHLGVAASKDLGDKAYASRDFHGAIARYSEALDVADDVRVLSNRSAAYSQIRSFHVALADAEHALSLCPEWGRLHHRRGFALFHLGRFGEALLAFESGLQCELEDTALCEAVGVLKACTEQAQPGSSPGEVLRQPSGTTASAATSIIITPSRRVGGFSAAAASVSASDAEFTAPAVPSTPPSTAPRASSVEGQGPCGTFTVVFDRVAVRAEPSVNATIVGVHVKGDIVQGVLCDVSGLPWLRLSEGRGWMLTDGASIGLGLLLAALPLSEGTPDDKQSALDLRERGNKFFRDQQYARALQVYSECVQRNPHDSRAWANRAASQTQLLQEAVTGMPAHVHRENAYFVGAMSDLKKALQIDPDYVKAYARQGQLLLLTGDRLAARQAYESGLQKDPNNADCLAGRDACR